MGLAATKQTPGQLTYQSSSTTVLTVMRTAKELLCKSTVARMRLLLLARRLAAVE